MRSELQAAYVLHHRPYRETSLLLDVFTRDHGRVALIAKGVHRPRSALRGVLHLFTPITLSWAGRGELGTVTAAEIQGPPRIMTGRLLWSAFYLNELMMRLLQRHDPHASLFDAYARALRDLGSMQPEEPVLRRFEKDLLEALGYGLMLAQDADEKLPIEAGRVYYYHCDQGPRRQPDTPDAVPVSGATLLAIAALDFTDPEVRRETKRLMRYVLRPHLGDKPLKSREFFRPVSGVSE